MKNYGTPRSSYASNGPRSNTSRPRASTVRSSSWTRRMLVSTAHFIIGYRHRVDSMALLQAASPHPPHGWPLLLFFRFSGPKWKFIWFRHRFIPRASVSACVVLMVASWRVPLPIYLRRRRPRRVVPKPLKFILNKLQRSRRCAIKIAPV